MMIYINPDDQQWTETPYDGIQMCVLRSDKEKGGGTVLIKFPKGARFPKHDHPGGEEVYVLEGEAVIGDVVVSKGDYLWTPPGGIHDVTAKRETILLVL